MVSDDTEPRPVDAGPRRRSWANLLGFGILAACYAGAIVNVAGIRRERESAGIIRVAHWQLEAGVREGMDELIGRFERLKAARGTPVRVIQIPITERSYRQYVTTQLVGGEPPDIIELGKFPEQLIGRYFLPISRELQEPNPFIALEVGNLLEKPVRTAEEEALLQASTRLMARPWIDSFSDGLRTMFRDVFQEYYGVGCSQFTVRLFYNRGIFRKALGHDRPPSTFAELFSVCRAIEQYASATGSRIVPIASSRVQMNQFRLRFLISMTSDVALREDLDLDGTFTPYEKLIASLSGRSGPDDPEYRAGIEIGRRLAEHFPRGFMASDRMDAGFAFVQGRAAMITSGSWDAGSYLRQIAGQPEPMRFEVGVCDVPIAGRDDPEFGRFCDGRVSEAATGSQFPFGITRASKQQVLCIEFLRFITTPANNGRLNERAEWIPSVTGAPVTPMLKPFLPSLVGVSGDMDLAFGARSEALELQEYWPYVSGEISYEDYARRIRERLPAAAATDFSRLLGAVQDERPGRLARRSTYLAACVLGPDSDRVENETKLLRAVTALASLERNGLDMSAALENVRRGQGTNENALARGFFEAYDRLTP